MTYDLTSIEDGSNAMMTSWSYSRLADFEKCKFLCYLKYVKKVPEPERQLPEGKKEHANDRGSRIHEAIESAVRGKSKFPNEAYRFRPEIDKLQTMFASGIVSLEGEWGMDRGWDPAPWKTAWLRLKLDGMAFLSPIEGVAIDYKTGRKYGNEIKHGEQLNLYALCAFLRYPLLEVVHAEDWYLDENDITCRTYTRSQSLRFKRNWELRGDKITTCTDWPPNPNKYSCRWCPYLKTEHCLVGVSS